MAGPVRPPSRGSGPHGAPLVSYESLEMMRKVQVKTIGGTTSSPGLPSSSRCSASPPDSGPDLRQLCLDPNFATEPHNVYQVLPSYHGARQQGLLLVHVEHADQACLAAELEQARRPWWRGLVSIIVPQPIWEA